MDNLTSNFKGSLTELQCLTKFTELGYQVSLPFGGQARYDFLVDINGKIIRVQVKTARWENGSIMFECRNSHFINGHHVHSKYGKKEIDYFSTYWEGKCYLIPIEECNNSKRLRIEPTQNTNVNWAKDYEIEEVLNRI